MNVNSSPKYIPKRNDKICPPKSLCKTAQKKKRLLRAVVFIIAKNENNTNIHQQEIDKQIVIYSYREILLSHKKNELLTQAKS